MVQFEGKHKSHYYIGNVIKKFQNELLVNFMKQSGNKFVWPEIDDSSTVDLKDIVAVLDPPSINNRQQYDFILKEEHKSFLARPI